jgi:hypothetical protein
VAGRTGANRSKIAGNPFTPDWGAAPPALVGRDNVLDRATAAFAAGPADPWFTHAYFGERGVGKTVVLDELGTRAATRGWAVAHTSVRSGGFIAPLLEVELVEAARHLSRRPRLEWLEGDTSWTAGAAIGGPPGPVARAERTRSVSRRLSDASAIEVALRSLGELAASKHVGVLITVDEVHAAEHPELSILSAAMQLVTKRRRLPVALVVAGLPNLPERLTGPDLTFLERMSKAELGYLDPPVVRLALAGPLATNGAGIDEPALEGLVQASGGYPYLVQLLGYHAWEVAGGRRVTEANAAAAIIGAGEQAAVNLFAPRWARLSPKEQRFVAAMAQLGDGPVPIGDIRRILGAATYEEVSYLRQRLIAKGILRAAGHGVITFTLPLFSRWIRSLDR